MLQLDSIYLITESLELLRLVVGSGISFVQLRDKERVDYAKAKEMRELCRLHDVLFIVNDRVDLALVTDADGVHLGQSDFPIGEARKLLGKYKIIGGTASNLEQLQQVIAAGADYVGVGHIFPTTTKIKEGPPLGTTQLAALCKSSSIPVVAVGGIQPNNIKEVWESGATAAAVCAAIQSEKDAKELVSIWKGFASRSI